jgi:multidrug efflux system outer membrane protein
MKYRLVPALLAAGLFIGCNVGPNYHRPAVQIPAAFHAPAPLPPQQAASLADLQWWDVFKDESLDALIRTALAQNYDLQDAVARVWEARANLGVTRSEQFPNFAAIGGISTFRIPQTGVIPVPALNRPRLNNTIGYAALQLLSFEVDIWGRLRRSTEAARAQLLQADENRKAVITTLVSDVATSYFTLRELDLELAISRRTLATRQESLRVVQAQRTGGVATLLDLRQAEQLVEFAAETIPSFQQQIEQTENQINVLLGKNPGKVIRGRSLTDQEIPGVFNPPTNGNGTSTVTVTTGPSVPVGLPSALLERRPDIRAAEQALIAANAQIGVAKAAYFPQIALSGVIGGESPQLVSLLSARNDAWLFGPQVTQPIFYAGRLGSNLKLSQAQRESRIIEYRKAIITAFSDVSNALIAYQRVKEERVHQEALVTAVADRKRLAYVRWRGGVDTMLNALQADNDLFSAELSLAQIRLNEVLSVVQLYKALGGGWQQ